LLELARAAARFVLPTDCLACRIRRVDHFLEGGVCAACWEALPARTEPRCARCDEALADAASLSAAAGAATLCAAADAATLCGRCLLDPPEFEALRGAAPYSGSAREIMLAFKFRGADYLASRLAGILVERLAAPEADEVACVPATFRARRARGYHPAEALAAALAPRLGLPLTRRRLVKRRATEVQSRLPLARRTANVRGAFRVGGRPVGRVLLVDDVATSGATARECARRLVAAGARAVTVWCFARASRADLPPEPSPEAA
jgi:predicted amidophosphoribosyltransferase